MQKKLTGWLIFLIMILILTIGSAGSAAGRIDQEFHSLVVNYPSVSSAILALELFNGTAVCASLYTAWVLYRKQSGTLSQVQTGLVVRFLCVAGGAVSFPMFAGLPNEMTASLVQQATYDVTASLAFTSIWFLYLMRSARVKEIYGS